MVCHGIAYIVLGCWIDANDNIYIENLAVDEKQCPPYCRRVGGGGVPLFVIRPSNNSCSCFVRF